MRGRASKGYMRITSSSCLGITHVQVQRGCGSQFDFPIGFGWLLERTRHPDPVFLHQLMHPSTQAGSLLDFELILGVSDWTKDYSLPFSNTFWYRSIVFIVVRRRVCVDASQWEELWYQIGKYSKTALIVNSIHHDLQIPVNGAIIDTCVYTKSSEATKSAKAYSNTSKNLFPIQGIR